MSINVSAQTLQFTLTCRKQPGRSLTQCRLRLLKTRSRELCLKGKYSSSATTLCVGTSGEGWDSSCCGQSQKQLIYLFIEGSQPLSTAQGHLRAFH